ncbi:GNAT family N-acetyltransferase [Wukongibacter baidiensis]|uniref:GNAT family N-acetyltransferase n=1 Tax=Wukongibacter baidiensis TaxID=1723361 RepID=UPI003D7F9307
MNIVRINAEDTWEIRHKVMWPNEDIDFVKMENDDRGIHYGIIEDKTIVSVISLFINEGKAQFRKFATLEKRQGMGYGSKLLSYVLEEAAKLGVRYIWCNARKEKAGFYRKFGLAETEKTFKKKGNEYVVMGKYLD